MDNQTLVARVCALPGINGPAFTLQGSDGRVINIKVMANEEHDTFAIGRFQRGADLGGGLTNPSDLHEQGGKAVPLQILHIRQQGGQGCLADRGERHVTVYDPPYATGRVDMLATYNGVVDKIFAPIDNVGNQSAFDHGIVYVCEGFGAAKALATKLNAAGLS